MINEFKKHSANYVLIFWIQKMNYIDTPTLMKKVKLAKNVKKINSCLLVSTFSIYLFNSFSFSLLSSPHPYYGFYFIYL